MYRPNFLKVLILFVCFTAVPGTLFTQTSSAQEDLPADPEPPSADPGTLLIAPGLPPADPEPPPADPEPPSADPGTLLADPGTLLIAPGLPPADPEPPSARDRTEEEPSDVVRARDDLRIFAGNVTVVAFAVLFVLYATQIIVAASRARIPVLAKRQDGSEGRISIHQAAKYFDDGLLNNWTFFVLVFFLPIFLSSISDVVPVLNPNLERIEDSYHQRFVSSSLSQVVYFMSIATISVLLTLEFSYINNLWKNASEWIPTLLAALALDFANLLVLNFFVQQPNQWTFTPSAYTQSAMIMAAVLAFCATFLILICARTAAALNAGQIDFPTSDDDIDRQEGKNIGGTEEDG